MEALDKHHYRRHPRARDFRGIVQGAGGQPMRFAASLSDRLAAQCDQLGIEQDWIYLPQPFPRDLYITFLGKTLARIASLLQHSRQRRRVQMSLVECDPAF